VDTNHHAHLPAQELDNGLNINENKDQSSMLVEMLQL